MAAIAILDDYQNVALRMADWSRLQKDHRIVVFTERLPDVDAAARALAEFDVIGIMRERTPFSARAVREAAQAAPAGDHRQAQRLHRSGSRQGAQRDRVQHRRRGPRHGRAGHRADAGPRPPSARGVQRHASRRRLADHARLRSRRQDARHPRARQPRRQGRQDRRRLRHEDDRLEREPHGRARQGARRGARRARTSCSTAPTSSPSTRCCRRARAGWSARASSP